MKPAPTPGESQACSSPTRHSDGLGETAGRDIGRTVGHRNAARPSAIRPEERYDSRDRAYLGIMLLAEALLPLPTLFEPERSALARGCRVRPRPLVPPRSGRINRSSISPEHDAISSPLSARREIPRFPRTQRRLTQPPARPTASWQSGSALRSPRLPLPSSTELVERTTAAFPVVLTLGRARALSSLFRAVNVTCVDAQRRGRKQDLELEARGAAPSERASGAPHLSPFGRADPTVVQYSDSAPAKRAPLAGPPAWLSRRASADRMLSVLDPSHANPGLGDDSLSRRARAPRPSQARRRGVLLVLMHRPPPAVLSRTRESSPASSSARR